MNLNDLAKFLEGRSKVLGFTYHAGNPPSETLLNTTEKRLQVHFPKPIRMFYGRFNGLSIDSPELTIHPLEELQVDSSSRMAFAVFDRKQVVCFDTSHLNEAEEWDILHQESGFRITLTMASFWSNKIWAWVEKRRRIWEDWVPT